ncbi:MAG: SDR family NAD(P)-dependent oxidoreductase [Bacteroidota bacterium]
MKKFAIVTGASGNLGYAVTQNLIKHGYEVKAYMSPWDGGKIPESEHVSSKKFDLCDEELVEESLTRIIKEKGIPELVITCAGGFAMDDIKTSNLSLLQEMFHKNFVTAYNVASRCFRSMEDGEKGGKIIMIGARQGINPETSLSTISYGLSKSLLFNYSRMLNEAGKTKNIQSHVIVPSIIDTPTNREAMPDANFSEWVTISDLVETINFLTSEAGSKICQNEIRVYNKS